MNKHGSKDLGSLRQGALSKPDGAFSGLVECPEATELSLISKGCPPKSPARGARHSRGGSVVWTVLRGESCSSFCAKTLASPSPILSSHLGPHWPPFSPGTTLGSSSQGHVESPFSGSLHSVAPVWVPHSQPCPGPSPPVRLDSAQHRGTGPPMCFHLSLGLQKHCSPL